MKVCRRTKFNSAHRLLNHNWSDEKNAQVFGKCNSPNYHGHNYILETWLEGEIDPDTGYVIDLGILKNIIKEEVEDPFDHKNLNLDCPEFKTLNPTAENIAVVIFGKLKKRLPQFKLTVRLYETENNYVEYSEDYD
ncbi:MAG: 6-carboxytetrahydropterin synthase [Crocinitomicaceae bacterium]|jgi:6-pyruvoyltetrahydropterin/6-carboxytetrahydropterin synthase|nr:6-carboxytetrahydropterin synthase [Crocinitomicaceae bacterium]